MGESSLPAPGEFLHVRPAMTGAGQPCALTSFVPSHPMFVSSQRTEPKWFILVFPYSSTCQTAVDKGKVSTWCSQYLTLIISYGGQSLGGFHISPQMCGKGFGWSFNQKWKPSAWFSLFFILFQSTVGPCLSKKSTNIHPINRFLLSTYYVPDICWRNS